MSLLETLEKSKVIDQITVASLDTQLAESKKLLDAIQSTKKNLVQSFSNVQKSYLKVKDEGLTLLKLRDNFIKLETDLTENSIIEAIPTYCSAVKSFSSTIDTYNDYANVYSGDNAFLALKDHSLFQADDITFDSEYLKFSNGTIIRNYDNAGKMLSPHVDCLGDTVTIASE